MSEEKTRKVTKRNIVDNKKAKLIKDQYGEDHILVVEEETFYTFTNLRAGAMFFKRSDGKEDMFQPGETKSDISTKDRLLLIKSQDFSNGWLIEEKELKEDEILNRNAISDTTLRELVKSHKSDTQFLKELTNGMTSEFTLNRLRDALVEEDVPGSVISFLDYRIKQLEEEYLESMKAPVDKEE